MKWTVFEFEHGGNPYVAKTNEERDRILKKYKGKVVQVSNIRYLVKE